jgi:molybdate transport system ATP-binding protein
VVATESGFPLTVVDRISGPVHVTFPAHAVTLHGAEPEGSARNTWPATIQRVDLGERRARVSLTGPIDVRADVTVRSVDDLGLRPGARVWVSVKATELAVVAH